VIDMQGVTLQYPGQLRPALKGIDLAVRAGSCFGLLGPNGSGKTTLISILAGLLEPTRGTAAIDGRELRSHGRDVLAFTSLVPQENAFYPTLTVGENLDFFARVQAIPAAQRAARLDEALAITGLATATATRAGRLSGGMKRRLSIAVGLLNQPRLLLLDEPTVGIDPQSRHFLLEAVRGINAAGTTVVYSSHYMEEVETLCDDIGILDDGSLVFHGSLGALLATGRGHRLRVDAASPLGPEQRARLASVPGLVLFESRIVIDHCPEHEVVQVLAAVRAAQVTVASVHYGAADLQEVFLALTSTSLRDH